MGIETIYRCDFPGCGEVRKPSNGWYQVGRDEYALQQAYVVEAFDPTHYDGKAKVFCGSGHAIQWLSCELPKLHGHELVEVER